MPELPDLEVFKRFVDSTSLHQKIETIEVASIGDVRRAKLYYLRSRVGKKARVRELRQG